MTKGKPHNRKPGTKAALSTHIPPAIVDYTQRTGFSLEHTKHTNCDGDAETHHQFILVDRQKRAITIEYTAKTERSDKVAELICQQLLNKGLPVSTEEKADSTSSAHHTRILILLKPLEGGDIKRFQGTVTEHSKEIIFLGKQDSILTQRSELQTPDSKKKSPSRGIFKTPATLKPTTPTKQDNHTNKKKPSM